MSESVILNIILIIVLINFAIDRVLSYLNHNSSKKPIPAELEGIYDEEKYAKSQAYHNVVNRFSNFSSTFSFIILFLAIYFGWFGWLDQLVSSYGYTGMTATVIFFAILFIISDIVGIPFSLYRTFVIEEKFGFNKTTLKTFITDKMKGYILGILIGGALLVTMLYIIDEMGATFWIYFWIVITVFILGMNMLYTSLILPLFNKLTPLGNGVLKNSIEEFSQKVKFPLQNIFVMDGSKRSSKGNAFFSGLGKKKKVVLFDTLIEKHSTDELTAVFAHEVGHYKKKHIYLSTILSVLQMGVMLYLLSLMIFNDHVSLAMGGVSSQVHLNILAFGILFSPLSMFLGIGMNLISRKNEYEADEYAVRNYGSDPLIKALKKLSGDHLSNLTPHPAFVFMNYSHPTLLQRVRAMEQVGG